MKTLRLLLEEYLVELKRAEEEIKSVDTFVDALMEIAQ